MTHDPKPLPNAGGPPNPAACPSPSLEALLARTIVENAADGIITADDSGTIAQFNPAAARIFGYSQREALGQNIKRLIPRPYLPEHPSYQAGAKPPAASTDFLLGREVTAIRKDGSRFPLELAVSTVTEGHHRLHIAIVRDVSERKKTEQALTQSREQLRSLAAHLQSVREEECTRIAREIHDELGQALTGVKMDVAWLASHLPAPPPGVDDRLRSTLALIDATIHTVRRIATELRPGVLDALGLPAALAWYADLFQKRTGIVCHLTSAADHVCFQPDHATALFRIFQETLTNVARHAGASRVEVLLELRPSQLRFSIHDNGRGIRPEDLTAGTSLGLLGIRERAAMIGGHVDIVGRHQSGTTLTVTVPLPPAPPPPAPVLQPHP